MSVPQQPPQTKKGPRFPSRARILWILFLRG
jgi:hypothetical protein